jgi:hypothetical protein
MKLFLCTWMTNYGLDCCVIAAKDKLSAELIANGEPSGMIWEDFELNEIITPNKEGILPLSFYKG